MNKKKILCIASFAAFLILGFGPIANAATVKTSVSIPYSTGDDHEEKFDWLGLDETGGSGEEGTISASLSKMFNFLKEKGGKANLVLDLPIGQKLTAEVGDVTGSWTVKGNTRKLDKNLLSMGSKCGGNGHIFLCYWTTFQVFDAIDNNKVEITSKNPAVVECTNSSCTAKKAGTAQVVVSFPKTKQEGPNQVTMTRHRRDAEPDWREIRETFQNFAPLFYGTDNGYGKIKFGAVDAARVGGSEPYFGNFKMMVYNFPSITYTVTVPATANAEPAATWLMPSPIGDTTATAKWKYADPENDKQTAYQVQISTNSNFTNIVKNLSGANANVTHAITGLSADTQYYGRVRAKNAVNTDWTAWSYGNFRTTKPTEPPVVCEGDDCDEGEGGEGSGFSCSVPGNPHSVGDMVTFEAANINGATYQWYGPGNSILDGETSRTYQERFDSPSQASRTVRATKDGNVYAASCTAAVGVTGGECDPATQVCGGAPAKATFYFNPNIVPSGQQCRLFLEAEDVTSCSLRNRMGTSIPFAGAEGVISVTGGQSVSVGTYTLSCTGTDGVTKTFETKACISAPDIKEE